MKDYGKFILEIHETIKRFLFYKEEELNLNPTKNFTVFELLQKISEKMDDYDRKTVSLQKKNAEYQLKYKIHECDISTSHNLEKSEVFPKIRNFFEAGEYNEGVELLKNTNYQKSSKVSYEEMLNWLAISNRIKDMKLDDLQSTKYHQNDKNKENIRNNNYEKKNKHLLISNQISSLIQENLNLKRELEKEQNKKEINNNYENKMTDNYNKIFHQQIDHMKWGYIEQIKEFEHKIIELQKEKAEFLLIIHELDRLVNNQKEIIAKNEIKFSHLKKYSM